MSNKTGPKLVALAAAAFVTLTAPGQAASVRKPFSQEQMLENNMADALNAASIFERAHPGKSCIIVLEDNSKYLKRPQVSCPTAKGYADPNGAK